MSTVKGFSFPSHSRRSPTIRATTSTTRQMAKTDNQNDMVSLSDRPCGTSLRLYDGTRKNISRVVFLRCRHEDVRCSFTLRWFAVPRNSALCFRTWIGRGSRGRATPRWFEWLWENHTSSGIPASHTTPVAPRDRRRCTRHPSSVEEGSFRANFRVS